ncbi:MAG: DUF3006 domain-containing protein [Bacillota bacterium]|nr:DUF3006 domain-containing protein [Bacillota bacterium]
MLIIDRFEGDWAVIEFGKKTFNFPKSLLPKEVKEGDVIVISVSIDRKATTKRERNIKKLADQLFED